MTLPDGVWVCGRRLSRFADLKISSVDVGESAPMILEVSLTILQYAYFLSLCLHLRNLRTDWENSAN